jgi:hypothetical protein
MGFPTDNPCNFLADDDLETDENGDPIPRMHIPEAVMCHVNATAGGPYVETGPPPHRTPTGRTFDRPITAMIQVSQDFLQGSHTVYVVALSDIPATGLRDGVASQTDYYKTAKNLSEEDSEGRNNVDLIFEQIKEDVEYGPCQPQKEAAFVGDPSQVTSPYDDGVFGYAYLRHEDGDITTPIKLNDDGFLEYTFNNVPEGNYTFEAYVQYYHPDDIMTEEPRQYSRIWNGTDAEDSMSILMRPSLDNLSGVTENDIQLVFDGSDACSD